MRFRSHWIICFVLFLIFYACHKNDEPTNQTKVSPVNALPIPKTNTMKVFAHYMIWFETNVSSGNGQWGWHWTMTNENPNIIDSTGKRKIASWFYPSIGPYASGDKNVIEYHTLLMKYAGIDGVIMDWYGSQNVNDYAGICKNAVAVAKQIGNAGLQFAICYEDQTLGPDVSAGVASDYEIGAQDDMNYLNSNFISSESYIQINGAPLLLDFGPATMTGAGNWTQALSVLSPKPCFLALWYHSSLAGSNANGEFAWVNQNNDALTSFYTSQVPSLNMAMGSAYPGFQDFYAQGGGGPSLGWTISYLDGATLRTTLQMAQNTSMRYLQLVTWNDFGEGTMIEPTREFGYQSLASIQNFTGVSQDTTVFYSISQLYALRVKYATNTSVQQSLDESFNYFVTLQPLKASSLLDSIQTNNH